MLPEGVRRLCLYGTADTVVAPDAVRPETHQHACSASRSDGGLCLQVRTFVEDERANGEAVEAREFSSAHVSHHLSSPDAYWAEVRRFIAAGEHSAARVAAAQQAGGRGAAIYGRAFEDLERVAAARLRFASRHEPT